MRAGKPTDNAHVEPFKGTLRQECLNAHWFMTRSEAKEIIEAWRREYNESRPHRALGEQTPNEFACQVPASRDLTGPEGAENSLCCLHCLTVEVWALSLNFAAPREFRAVGFCHATLGGGTSPAGGARVLSVNSLNPARPRPTHPYGKVV